VESLDDPDYLAYLLHMEKVEADAEAAALAEIDSDRVSSEEVGGSKVGGSVEDAERDNDWEKVEFSPENEI
jgi:hypothetical protein